VTYLRILLCSRFWRCSLVLLVHSKRHGLQLNWAGVLDVTRLLFKDGIQLNGLPAPPAEIHRRLFALSPCRSAVSPLPPGILNDLTRFIVLSPNGRSVSAPEPRLSPHVFAGVAVLHGGRSFLKRIGVRKPSASSPAYINAE